MNAADQQRIDYTALFSSLGLTGGSLFRPQANNRLLLREVTG